MRLEAMASDGAGKPQKVASKLPAGPKMAGPAKPSMPKPPKIGLAKAKPAPKAGPVKQLTTKKKK